MCVCTGHSKGCGGQWGEFCGRSRGWGSTQAGACVSAQDKLSDDAQKKLTAKARRKYPKWKQHTGNTRIKLGIARDENPWTGRGVNRPGLPACARVHALADVAMAAQMIITGLPLEEARVGFFVSCDQSVHLEPWGATGTTLFTILTPCRISFLLHFYIFWHFGIYGIYGIFAFMALWHLWHCESACIFLSKSYIRAGTLRQKSIQYSFEFDKVFECTDHTSALGWPPEDEGLADLTPHALKSLAGEGMSAPCIGSVLYAFWLNPWAPWWKSKDCCEHVVSKTERYTEADVVDLRGRPQLFY
jgi:hypothetical protein